MQWKLHGRVVHSPFITRTSNFIQYNYKQYGCSTTKWTTNTHTKHIITYIPSSSPRPQHDIIVPNTTKKRCGRSTLNKQWHRKLGPRTLILCRHFTALGRRLVRRHLPRQLKYCSTTPQPGIPITNYRTEAPPSTYRYYTNFYRTWPEQDMTTPLRCSTLLQNFVILSEVSLW